MFTQDAIGMSIVISEVEGLAEQERVAMQLAMEDEEDDTMDDDET